MATKLTPFELYELWRIENPGSKANPVIMAAIALAESAGDPENINSIGACGLWQIHPYEAGCTNSNTNAKQAGRKFATQGYGAWESYTNGSYKQFIPTVEKSLKNAGVNENVQGAGILGLGIGPSVAPEASEEAKSAVEGAFSWTKELGEILAFLGTGAGWLRIGKVVGGAALLLVGIAELTKVGAGGQGKSVANTAKKVGEVAAAGTGAGLALAAVDKPKETESSPGESVEESNDRVTQEVQSESQRREEMGAFITEG